MRRQQRTVAEGWVPTTHGIPSSYNRGCRCDECTAVNTERQRHHGYMRDFIARNHARRVLVDGQLVAPLPPERHGQYSTYTAYGCRCDLCRAAGREYARAWRAKRSASNGAPG